MPTHYEVLGVPMHAGAEDIRRAYLELARVLHPDRALGASTDAPRASRRMQDVNEAWRVLRDPTSRAAYDRALTGRRISRPQIPFPNTRRRVEDDPDLDVPFSAAPARPGDIGVSVARALPWLVLVFVLGAIFVFTAFAGDDLNHSGPDDLVGRCVSSGSASSVAPVPCQGPNEGQVVLVVDRASRCPEGASGRAIEGNVWLCVRPFRGSTTTQVFPTATTSTSVP